MQLLLCNECVHHVAMYVMTENGDLILQISRSKGTVQAFGGCNYPNNVLRMLNSLRLELMDECGLLLNEENMAGLSPLYAVQIAPDKAVLIQIALVRDAACRAVPCSGAGATPVAPKSSKLTSLGIVNFADCSLLWSPEKARSCFGPTRVPNDIVFAAQELRQARMSHQGGPFSAEHLMKEQRLAEVRVGGDYVRRFPFLNPRGAPVGDEVATQPSLPAGFCVADHEAAWRPCDWSSFALLKDPTVNAFQSLLSKLSSVKQDCPPELVLLVSPSGSRYSSQTLQSMVDSFNHQSLRSLRDVARSPWSPILWDDALLVFAQLKEAALRE
jgi:hypothetical protein